jgi:tetratricopeptide (TPR) repeat protein
MALKRDEILASAEKLLAKGKQDAALKEYLRLLQDNPNDVLVLNKVGDLYVLLNRPADSIPHFSRIAQHYAHDGFFLKAIAIYKKINKLDPSKLEVYQALAELYHKQGLIPEARAQFQILADHYLKQNQLPDAIAVYKKMAAVDPNDIKVPVRLADLLTSAGQTEEALMQYGIVGSMLVKRGAMDEAVAVYQKALKIRPGDKKILADLVRSMLEGGNADAAAVLLRSQPREAWTMLLLAQALSAAHKPDEARQAAEGAIAFDHGNEGARLLLAEIHQKQKNIAGALEALKPLVDRYSRSGEIKKAIGLLVPLSAAGPAAGAVQEKLLELYRMSGEDVKVLETLTGLARFSESRRDQASALRYYREVLELDPENAEARHRVMPGAQPNLSPVPPAAGTGRAPVLHAPPAAKAADPPLSITEPPSFGEGLLLDLDESALSADPAPVAFPSAPPAATAPSPAKPQGPPEPPPLERTDVRRRLAEEAQWKDSITEAEVLAKYGLIEKAADKFRAMLRRRRDDLAVRRRYVELLAELKSPVLGEEAATLAAEYRTTGQSDEADQILDRYLPASPSPPESGPPGSFGVGEEFDEFSTLAHGAPVPRPQPSPDRLTPSSTVLPASPPSVAPADLEYTFDAGLGRALEDEMARFQASLAEPSPPATSAMDEKSLFSDEQKFFDLAAELEKELEEEEAPTSPVMEGAGQEVSLEEIFREFKKGVEQQLSPEDYETHYNLGIAYKEMGLLDEAIGEFQIAAKDPARAVECCSMLGLCFIEKGIPQLAMQWYEKGLENPAIRPEERLGLQYDLAALHEQNGENKEAYRLYLDVYGQNTNYRDVIARVKNLEGSVGR